MWLGLSVGPGWLSEARSPDDDIVLTTMFEAECFLASISRISAWRLSVVTPTFRVTFKLSIAISLVNCAVSCLSLCFVVACNRTVRSLHTLRSQNLGKVKKRILDQELGWIIGSCLYQVEIQYGLKVEPLAYNTQVPYHLILVTFS